MKQMKLYISLLIGICIVVSCQKDNYPGPNAKIYGGIFDSKTHQLIPQDNIYGSQIVFIELGYATPTEQYMIFMQNGSYRNDLIFSGTYSMQPRNGNFIPPALDTITLPAGETRLNFTAQPYIRIKNCTIQKSGANIVASFNVVQTTADNVGSIALFADKDSTQLGSIVYELSESMDINANIDSTVVQTITIDPTAHTNVFLNGRTCFFRAGAVSVANGAKYNFAKDIIGIKF